MKKISRAVINFFKAIIHVFDKILITPITKLFLKILSLFKINNFSFERFINNRQVLIVISLLLALGVFYVIDKNTNTIINQSAEILYNQPVSAEYNEEAYVIEGLPKSVDITLIGRSSDIYLAKQYPTSEVSVDLRDLKPGSHTVQLKYKQTASNISYKLDPSVATIMVYEKVSETKELAYDILHKDSLDSKYIISDVKLDRNDVIVKGAEYKLKDVASVKALIDVDNMGTQTTGEINLKSVDLVAYDASGSIVEVEMVPSTISATVKIDSPKKELPIEIVPVGDIAFGKSISAINTSSSSITLYGNSDVLDSMDTFKIEIDVNGLDSDKDFNINLKNPNGIREMSVKTVNVNVKLSDSITKEFEGVNITPINIENGYRAQAMSEEDSKVTVVVTGSSEVVNSIDASQLVASVDLTGLTEGEYDVEVKVSGTDNKITYQSKTNTVKIKIMKN